MAEWLRRWTANPLGSARAGSNPADVEFFSRDSVVVITFALHAKGHGFEPRILYSFLDKPK